MKKCFASFLGFVLAGILLVASQATGTVAPISFVQGAETSSGAGTSSLSQAFPAVSTSGDLIAVGVKWGNSSVAVSSISDNKGNIYTSAVGPTNWSSNNKRAQLFYAKNIVGGGTPIIITVKLTASSTSSFHIYQFEYAHADTTSPLDVATAAIGTGTAVSSGSATTTSPSDLIFGFAIDDTGNLQAGAGFVARATYHGNLVEDKNVTVTGSYSATATNSTSSNWFMQMAAFKAAGASPTSGLIPHTNWSVLFVDSQEMACYNGAGTNAINPSSTTMWHTQFCAATPAIPHEVQINLGASYTLTGFQYLPRQDGCANGWIKQYEFYVSSDGANWSTPVASGTFNYGNLSTTCPGAGIPAAFQTGFPPISGQYVRLRALSEINGNPWTSAKQINVLGTVATPAVVAVSVSPASASLQTGGTQQFTPAVTGTTNTAVTWSASGGSVSAGGLYAAPTSPGSYIVTATSVADTTKSASAAVNVIAPVAVSISPLAASISTGGTQQFAATVTGTTNTAVTWSASGGTVSTAGLYTAPSTSGTYTVKATSVADTTKSALAAVTVTAPPTVAISVSPTSASLSTGGTQQFAATVTGTTNTAVTWSASGGTVSAAGLYTAPSSLGTYTVTATSVADTSKLASAIVTVSAVATPTFSPGTGTYSSPQTVTISSTTSGATICYTTDGSNPGATTPGTCSTGTMLANGATVMVTTSETLKAIGTESGFTNSAVGSASYTISTCAQNLAIGNFTLCGGAYNDISSGSSVQVNYNPVAGNGIIAYATWCFNASCNSSTAGITATIGDNINATESCFTASPHSPFITDADGGAQGSGDFQQHYVWYCPSIPSGVRSFTVTPSSPSLSYLQLNISEWKAGSLAASCSPISACFEDVDNFGQAGNSTGGTTATITTSGSTVNANDLVWAVTGVPCCSFTASPGTGYTGITVAPSVTPGMVSEAKAATATGIQTATTTWTGGSTPWFGVIVPLKGAGAAPVVATPTFSPGTGTYSSAQTVAISSTTSGATICYTTDGSNPTATTPGICATGTTLANGASVMVSVSETLKAIGTESGFTNSGIGSAAYTITSSVNVVISVSPTAASLLTGGTQQFSATVTGTTNTSVSWTASGGTVSSTGMYTAPSAAGSYTVKATSAADTSKSASATVTVAAPVVISVSPTNASLLTGGTQQFTATVTGTSNTAATWSATGGSISTIGFYTAPASAGIYTVIATSAADTTKSASATVTVSSPAVVAVSIAPISATLTSGATQQFTATVTGTTNPAVTWMATGGTVSASGLYTAPPTAGSYTVTATSQADTTKSASATVTVNPSSGAVPGLVQSVSCANSENAGLGLGGTSSTPDYKCPLPELTLSNNLLVLHVFYNNSSSPAVTVSDQQGDVFIQAITETNAAGNVHRIYYAITGGGTNTWVNVHFSAATGFVTALAQEFYNVSNTSPLDGASCMTSTSTSITAGSVTPTQSGDLVVQHGIHGGTVSSGEAASSFTAGQESNITWNLATADLQDGQAVQWGVYNSTAAINPTFSQGASVPSASCAAFFKAAAAGTAPSKSPRINSTLHQELPNRNWGSIVSSAYDIEMPSSGNLLIAAYESGGSTTNGGCGNRIASITSSGQSWANTGALNCNVQIWYLQNPTVSNNLPITVNFTDTDGDGDFVVYDVAGMATSGVFDKDVTSSGTASGASVTLSPIAPSSSSTEMLVLIEGNAWCTANSITAPSGGRFDAATYTGDGVDGPEPVDENNAKGHFYSNSTASETWTIGYNCSGSLNGGAVAQYYARVAAFKSAGGSIPVSVSITPVSASLLTGGTQQFTATVSGSSNTAVTWSTTGGTISSSGLYTAPTVSGTYIVTATSIADSTKSASATVSVGASAAVAVSISPSSASLLTGGSQQFTAVVTGASNTGVTWKATAGTISTAGLYTAPTTGGNYTVTATSVADTSKSASATVTVSASIQHTVTLTWTPDTSAVAGYNVYRGTVSGGPYTQINPVLDAAANFVDNTVQSGQTYFYVTTAVGSTGLESAYSNQVTVLVPSP